jgi:hypothetical protein
MEKQKGKRKGQGTDKTRFTLAYVFSVLTDDPATLQKQVMDAMQGMPELYPDLRYIYGTSHVGKIFIDKEGQPGKIDVEEVQHGSE